jgi:hypothetical protein
MNQERSILRAASDNGLTLYLDKVDPATKAEEYRARAHGIALQVLAFLQNGNAVELTQGELRTQLVKLVPTEYQTFLDQLIGAVSPLHLDVNGHVGPNNVKRLEAVCLGVIRGSTHYKLEDRKDYLPPVAME